MTDETVYRYAWKNNSKRAALFGRTCRIVAFRGKDKYLVEFENGQREIVCRFELRRVEEEPESHKARGRKRDERA
ncbi:MAG: hypothetical protein ACM3MF_03710 [Anaerolineae bacterium]